MKSPERPKYFMDFYAEIFTGQQEEYSRKKANGS